MTTRRTRPSRPFLHVAAMLCAASCAVAQPRPAPNNALPAIAAESLRVHVAALAHDSMEGRATATRGHARAATYVAARFAAAGLAPGAGGGEWLQPVPLRRRDLDAAATTLTVIGADDSRRTFRAGEAFVPTRPGAAAFDVEAPVVFVGYGVTSLDGSHDDYAGIDARGKIVAFLPGAPATLGLDERTYQAGAKLRAAAAHGAVATLRLWTPEEARGETWEHAVASYDAAGLFTWALDTATAADRGLAEHAWLGPAATAALLTGAPNAIGVRVGTRVRLTGRGRVATAASPNVVALLRGADRVLRDEYVVVSAHLDGLGIGAPIGGDSVYNGAVDNASGVAALLELARAFAAMPSRPRRSLLFVAFTGEEAGTLGSEHFVAHPPVPRSSIVANVNVDGASVWAFDGIVPRGAEHSTLAGVAVLAAERAGTRVVPDPIPGRTSLAGSDQYPFLTAGIPAVIPSAARSGAARDLALAWVRDRYHAPSDDLAQPLDFDAAARFTRSVLALADAVARAPRRPQWNAGDFFARLGAAVAAVAR